MGTICHKEKGIKQKQQQKGNDVKNTDKGDNKIHPYNQQNQINNSVSSHCTSIENNNDKNNPNDIINQEEEKLNSIKEEVNESGASFSQKQSQSLSSYSQSRNFKQNATISENPINEEDEEDDTQYQIDYIKGGLIEESKRVYSALNVQNGQLLAVKMIQFDHSEDIESINERVDQLLKLEHENIHQICGFDLNQNELNIVMPFESGGSIKWLLQKFNKFSPQLAILFMKQILEGLMYLHQEGICHMNLKTSNVLVDEEANAKLSDINILSQYQLSSYSAPECFDDEEYTIYSDVWSAGCIFMEMMTQHNPWDYYEEQMTLQQIHQVLSNGKLFPIKKIIKNLELQRCLQLIFKQDPNQRLTPAQLLDLDLFKNPLIDEKLLSSISRKPSQNKKQNKLSTSNRLLEKESSNSIESFYSSMSKSNSINKKKQNFNGIQKQNQSKVLQRWVTNIKSIEFDQFSGGEAADGSNVSLSLHDVKMLTKKLGFNKKSHPIFSKDIIEEEQESKHQINPLLQEGFIRNINDQQFQLQRITSEDIDQPKGKKNKQHRKSVSIFDRKPALTKINHKKQAQKPDPEIASKLTGKKIEDIIQKPEHDFDIVNKLLGGFNDEEDNNKQSYEQKDKIRLNLEEAMEEQFFKNLKQQDSPEIQLQQNIYKTKLVELEDQLNKNFVDDEEVEQNQISKKENQNKLNDLEAAMELQFFNSDKKLKKVPIQQMQSMEDKLNQLENAIEFQYQQQQSSNKTIDNLNKLEQMMMNQWESQGEDENEDEESQQENEVITQTENDNKEKLILDKIKEEEQDEEHEQAYQKMTELEKLMENQWEQDDDDDGDQQKDIIHNKIMELVGGNQEQKPNQKKDMEDYLEKCMEQQYGNNKNNQLSTSKTIENQKSEPSETDVQNISRRGFKETSFRQSFGNMDNATILKLNSFKDASTPQFNKKFNFNETNDKKDSIIGDPENDQSYSQFKTQHNQPEDEVKNEESDENEIINIGYLEELQQNGIHVESEEDQIIRFDENNQLDDQQVEELQFNFDFQFE